MKRTVILITLVAIAVTLSSTVIAEINGFRGMNWGADFSKVKDKMTYVATDPSYGGMQCYINKSDELKIGGAKLRAIIYKFWHNKLCSVRINFKGYTNFAGVKEAAINKYGENWYQDNPYIEDYIWLHDEKATIRLKYSEVSDEGSLSLSSNKISEEQESYNAEKAKKGAKTDF